MSLVDDIASMFPGSRQTGPGQFIAPCNSHDDNKESLSIGNLETIDGGVGLFCHAGCPSEVVAKNAGIDFPLGLMPPRMEKKPKAKPKLGKIVTTYNYEDENGQVLFRKVRYEPKDFRLQRPDGNGWKAGIDGIRRVPFNLRAILAAEPDDLICICEGERDAATLTRLGFIATCNFDGASKNPNKPKWLPEYNQFFIGRHCVIWADNDAAGIAHAEAVAAALLAAGAASVRIICFYGLPTGGDVTDLVELHNSTGDDLYSVICAVPEWRPSSSNESASEVAPSVLKKKDRPDSVIYNAIESYEEDSEGNEQKVTEPLTMAEVKELIRNVTNNFPRRTGNALFIHCPMDGIAWLEAPSAMFGWLADTAGVIDWHKTRGCVSREEVFHEFRRSALNYAAVENLPHEPLLPNHYYACPDIAASDGKYLGILLDRFSPETEIDRDLIQAFLMTIMWGGQGGMRPVFVVTTADGPGSGKTTLVRISAQIFGGLMSFDRGEQVQEIKTRLLSADALTKRLALIDNVKTQKWSWGEFEGLITSPVISGRRMYLGEGSRPNTLTWAMTLNGANLSNDMAQRAVIIRLSKPTTSGSWEDETRRFIEEHRMEIIADLIGALRIEPHKFSKFTRWADWESAVLARVPNPAVAQQAIADRQGAVDADREENETLEDYYGGELRSLGYDIRNDRIFIPSKTSANWFNRATGEKFSPTAVTRHLRKLIGEKKLTCITESTGNANGRGVVWAGVESFGRNTFIDLPVRIAKRMNQRNVASRESEEVQESDFEVT